MALDTLPMIVALLFLVMVVATLLAPIVFWTAVSWLQTKEQRAKSRVLIRALYEA